MKKPGNVGMTIVCCLLLLVGVLFIFLTNFGKDAYLESYNENNKMIGALSEELYRLEHSIEGEVDIEVVKVQAKSCAELGRRVAELQTNYQYLSASQQEDLFMENVNALDVCFDEFSKNCRVPWYGVTYEDTAEWTWTFQSTYEFIGKKVDVVWLCYENTTGDLLAYATGVYDTESELFSNIEWTMTSIGAEFYYKDPTPGVEGKPENTTPDESMPNETNPDITDPSVDSTEPSDNPEFPEYPDDPGDIGGGGVADTPTRPE